MSTPKPQVVRRRPGATSLAGEGRAARGSWWGRARIIAAAIELFGAKGLQRRVDGRRRAGVGRHQGGAVLPLHGQVRPVHDGRPGADRVDPRGDGRGRERRRHARGAPARGWRSWASSGWRRTSMRRISMRTSTSTRRTTSSSTRRWTSSRSPSSAASRRPARPIARLSPKAASELLGGVLFSLIFTPGRERRDSPLPEGPGRAREAGDPAVPRRLLVARAGRGPAALRRRAVASRRPSRARDPALRPGRTARIRRRRPARSRPIPRRSRAGRTAWRACR